ncbi:2-keto-4-pentenoate hydratase/2-oxohepta-3-ene-1,7-dioic acid hydratase in catechol pathway [Actinocorallia herbida]|uniref:2-keto-4-pentenoate hydratase/2-oxohepta-3-ene-1,7-dioic acid hydratase in catechol pathway n=1 Tax=Actinocorallia herbida TaxID=58109 RepID=A0A3N1CY29_9ACTN|nr:fumarylacetoacetate hydrolase family protein [Actinocorallia herbida]ROO86156.1 2-keto-4-pentenoate hydratase/2-oxohepta-3-ene-1,7-dioic acid hydratase in catechol pathway [Actinocorallia herbida]
MLRIANVDGRATVVGEDLRVHDVAEWSDGRFGPDPRSLLEDWTAFRAWAEGRALRGGRELDRSLLRPPLTDPRQVFAVGMNYVDHAAEIGAPLPEAPSVFTKYRSCLTGAFGAIELVDGPCDWEVEVVVVIGRAAHRVSAERGWDHVAGLTIGQDISQRRMQTAGASPQFSLAKSFPTFGPLGPWLITPDALPDPDRLALGCSVNGDVVQQGSTADLVFPVPELVARLSQTVPLLPGDLIFTGTPSGVGAARSPQRFLAPGDVVESWVDGIGRMRNECVAAPEAPREKAEAGSWI